MVGSVAPLPRDTSANDSGAFSLSLLSCKKKETCRVLLKKKKEGDREKERERGGEGGGRQRGKRQKK